MAEVEFPEGWTAHELGMILNAMQRLPQWGRPGETVVVDFSGQPTNRRGERGDGTLIGSFHWSERSGEWRFVPAWRPSDSDALR